MTRWLPYCLLCLLILGCGPRKADPASVAADQVKRMIYTNQLDGLLNVITPGSRKALLARIAVPSDASPKTLSEHLAAMTDWRFDHRAAGRTRVVEGKTNPEKRLVEVDFGGRKIQFPVERVGLEWKVDLINAKTITVKPQRDEQ